MGPEDDVYEEHTLLLDPCFDDPEDYLGYDPTGQIFSLGDNPNGKRTIEVLHLSRRRLKSLRQETMQGVTRVLRFIANDAISTNAGALAELRAWIEGMQASGSPYSGLARYVVRRPAEFGVGGNT